ncbi:unnamed protein product [Arctogadus glacialis]
MTRPPRKTCTFPHKVCAAHFTTARAPEISQNTWGMGSGGGLYGAGLGSMTDGHWGGASELSSVLRQGSSRALVVHSFACFDAGAGQWWVKEQMGSRRRKTKIREEHIWSSGWNTRGVEVWGRGMGSSEDFTFNSSQTSPFLPRIPRTTPTAISTD